MEGKPSTITNARLDEIINETRGKTSTNEFILFSVASELKFIRSEMDKTCGDCKAIQAYYLSLTYAYD